MTRPASRTATPAMALALAGFVATGITATTATTPRLSDTLAQRLQAGMTAAATAVQDVAQAYAPQAQPQQVAAAALPPVLQKEAPQPAQQQVFALSPQMPAQLGFKARPQAGGSYYDQLRGKLRWVDVRFRGNMLRTPDPVSRILLAQSAAQRAGLHEVGLSYRDVYGIINAETSWVPRMGASKDGTPNLGIAQFEPATARALGLRNPHDPVEAVHVAALHMKEAAVWSARKLDGLKLPPQVHAAKLREGVSIYYNLSTKGRQAWNGVNTAKLPVETRRHISNAARGAREAATLEARLQQMRAQGRDTASNTQAGGFLRTGG